MSKRHNWTISLVAVTTVAVPLATLGVATAQQSAAPSTRQACMPDYEKFCSNVPMGGGRIRACFEAHASELSAGCKQAIAASASAKSAPGASPNTPPTQSTP